MGVGTAAPVTDRLARLNTSLVSDVLDEAGWRHQVLSSAIRPLVNGLTLAGPAVCFCGRAVGTTGADATTISAYALDRAVFPGAVLVIDAGQESMGATIGGLIALSLKLRGCGGLVNDGAVRDSAEIAEIGLTTFTRHVTPRNSAGRWSLLETQGSIAMQGQSGEAVEVDSGDLILADDDGILVIPQRIAEPVIIAAEQLQAVEDRIVAQLQAGDDREQVFAAHPRFAHIKPIMRAYLDR